VANKSTHTAISTREGTRGTDRNAILYSVEYVRRHCHIFIFTTSVEICLFRDLAVCLFFKAFAPAAPCLCGPPEALYPRCLPLLCAVLSVSVLLTTAPFVGGGVLSVSLPVAGTDRLVGPCLATGSLFSLLLAPVSGQLSLCRCCRGAGAGDEMQARSKGTGRHAGRSTWSVAGTGGMIERHRCQSRTLLLPPQTLR
jgi:hypothetical protein